MKRSSVYLAIREMKFKTTLRFYLIPSQNGNNQENKHQTKILAKMEGWICPYTLLVGLQSSVVTMDNIMIVPQ